MRAPPGFDALDPLGRQCPRTGQELRIFLGVDVVGDCRDVVIVAQLLAQGVHQGRFSRAHRSADTDAKGFTHDRNNLVYWVS